MVLYKPLTLYLDKIASFRYTGLYKIDTLD